VWGLEGHGDRHFVAAFFLIFAAAFGGGVFSVSFIKIKGLFVFALFVVRCLWGFVVFGSAVCWLVLRFVCRFCGLFVGSVVCWGLVGFVWGGMVVKAPGTGTVACVVTIVIEIT